jgi:hypothetical protein
MIKPEEPEEGDKAQEAQIYSWDLVVYVGKEYKWQHRR